MLMLSSPYDLLQNTSFMNQDSFRGLPGALCSWKLEPGKESRIGLTRDVIGTSKKKKKNQRPTMENRDLTNISFGDEEKLSLL